MHELPLLYTFRRCPYAIRARLAIASSQIEIHYHEVSLQDKPKEMLTISPKGTVPVLELNNGDVIDESMEIMFWALNQNDPGHWLPANNGENGIIHNLINSNDNEFKQHLDHYKYADRFPEHSIGYYRQKAEVFIQRLEDNLTNTTYLVRDEVSLADIAIFPFIRQFAFVDKDWFDQSQYVKCQSWLKTLLDTRLFTEVMKKRQ